jgi:hypothetical protein
MALGCLLDGPFTAISTAPNILVMAALFIVTALATPIIPTAALVVLMSPVAFNTADRKTRHFWIMIRIPINQVTKPLFWLNPEKYHEKPSYRLHMPV